MWSVGAVGFSLPMCMVMAEGLLEPHGSMTGGFALTWSLVPLSVACDDECAGVLLDDLDNIADAILSVNLTGAFPLPYGILSNLKNTTEDLRVGARCLRHGKVELRAGRWSPAVCLPHSPLAHWEVCRVYLKVRISHAGTPSSHLRGPCGPVLITKELL